MRILIVGGNRFVGADVVSHAVMEGHDVTVAALDPPNIRARKHVRFVQANRNNAKELTAGFKGLEFDAVLDNIAFVPENVEILMDVLKGRIGRYVLTSTVDIYPRDISCFINAEKHEVLNPSDLDGCPKEEKYLRGKRGCEKVLRKSGLPWTVIRPAIVYGLTDPIPPAPRMLRGLHVRYGRSLFFPSRVIDGGPILLRRNDRRVFRLANSQDVANALLLVAQHPEAVGKAFNVAGDEIWTSARLIHALCNAAGTEPNIVRVSNEELDEAGLGDYDSPYGRVKWWSIADNRHLKALGWKPSPASVQLIKLVEAVPPYDKRPFYDRRVQEIALAKRILRRQKVLSVHPLPIKPEPKKKNGNKTGFIALDGQYNNEEAEKWKNNLIRSHVATPVPHEDHFRNFHGRLVSSIGIGTHRGDVSPETDELYAGSLEYAVKGGINLIDTAINYRRMRAERTIGRVLRKLNAAGISRDALCLCSKGGFVPQDADDPRDVQEYIWDEFVSPGLLNMNEAIRRHSVKPGFIRKLLGLSLCNLGVRHIDLYYVHNPERALAWMGPDLFYATLRQTFTVLEEAAADGKIGAYGISTWQGLRTSPKNEQYLPLEKIFAIAQEVGGSSHHFRAIQFPLNVFNKEALNRKNQEVEGEKMTLLDAADSFGLYTFTSASIYRGQDLPQDVIERIASVGGEKDQVETILNFARSAPGVGTALVGMRKLTHVEKTLLLASRPKMSDDDIQKIMG